MRWIGCSLLASCLTLTGCSGVNVDVYSDNTPVMNPRSFFDGALVAHGVVKNRSGEVIRRFSADIQGSWQDGVGTLDEDFVFDDGETDRRVWTLRPHPDGGYTGTAGDVVGEGRIRLAGNAMFLDYVLQVPWRDGTIDLRVDDRMYLVTPDVLINESIMSKFGVRVGEILLTIRRLEDGQS
jgi:hypothetical protein